MQRPLWEQIPGSHCFTALKLEQTGQYITNLLSQNPVNPKGNYRAFSCFYVYLKNNLHMALSLEWGNLSLDHIEEGTESS